MKTSFTAFMCVDESKIHLANVKKMTLIKYQGIEFIYVNDKRLLNNKVNKRLMQVIFPFLVYSGKKLVIDVQEVKQEDVTEQ